MVWRPNLLLGISICFEQASVSFERLYHLNHFQIHIDNHQRRNSLALLHKFLLILDWLTVYYLSLQALFIRFMKPWLYHWQNYSHLKIQALLPRQHYRSGYRHFHWNCRRFSSMMSGCFQLFVKIFIDLHLSSPKNICLDSSQTLDILLVKKHVGCYLKFYSICYLPRIIPLLTTQLL